MLWTDFGMRQKILVSLALAASALAVSAAGAQTASSHYDLNVYPAMGGGPFDFTSASTQGSPPGTITATSATPKPAYSFADMLANTHGYVETSVSSRGGYGFDGGVLIPLVPGKADLELGGGTGQIAGLPSFNGSGKHETVTYDTYYAALHIHPSDDFDASIGISGLRLHGPAYLPYGVP